MLITYIIHIDSIFLITVIFYKICLYITNSACMHLTENKLIKPRWFIVSNLVYIKSEATIYIKSEATIYIM